MKTNLKLLLLALALFGTTMMPANDYVLLNPLDTSALPIIPNKDSGGAMVRAALSHDAMWDGIQHQLIRDNFSEESVYKQMVKLYRHTHKHYVTFPVAYWSQTPQGDSLMVSGRVYLPKQRYLNGIVIACHYTICSDAEAPSNTFSMESMFTTKGYAVIMPDYVGYGLSNKELHPYLHWRNAAQTAVDLLNNMPSLLDYYGYSYPKDVVVSGYSQGGSVALGVARMIEENASALPWTVRKLYAGAGPYDPAATYAYCVEIDTMGIPAVIPMIVMGLSKAYNLGFELEDFFYEPLLSNYDEWIGSKLYTVQQINDLMGTTCMSKLMTAQALDMNDYLAEMLYEALEWNSNVGYDLQSPAYFLHSVEDDVMPLLNTLNLESIMPDNTGKEYDLNDYGSHLEANIQFMKSVYQDL